MDTNNTDEEHDTVGDGDCNNTDYSVDEGFILLYYIINASNFNF